MQMTFLLKKKHTYTKKKTTGKLLVDSQAVFNPCSAEPGYTLPLQTV